MIKLDCKGLVPAIIQDATTGDVLTLGYMSPESLKRTIKEKDVWFHSRSRQELWHKGETSGNYLRVRSIKVDCDGDAVLVKVDPEGPSCHTGSKSCFSINLLKLPEFSIDDSETGVLDGLFRVIEKRKRDLPEGSYTTSLFQKGTDRISQKVIEEAGEMALAGVRGDKEHLIEETADLIYHMMVLLSDAGVNPDEIRSSLQKRSST
jgi:phosphoribosyl-ATP pyrophosphohydrolase/phosphoribosyl-AMP cyclohydrolase